MIEISDFKKDRYARLKTITWWDQDILKNANILVVGCGALGNEIVKNLTMLGVGNIFVVDMDVVEKSNLTRSILFRKEDEGRSKAETICKRANDINNEVNVRYFNGNVFELGLGEFRKMDIVVCGLDSREARLFVNQSCWKVNRPWIDGAIEVLNGVARMFIPPDGACYECTMSENDYLLLNKRKSCMLLGLDEIHQGKIPTTPTVASIIAGIQVQEAVKYLHKRDDMLLLNGKGFVFNGGSNESYIVEYQRREDCPSHYTFENFHKIEMLFNEVTVNDIINFGNNYFKNENFSIEFNNETIFELLNEETKESIEHFANLNLLTQKDVMRGGILYKVNSFHNFYSNSGLSKSLQYKTLTDIKVPFNDILTLRKGNDEIHVEFISNDIFK
ncbi:MAG: ThiF family adenylyltransferase [Ignavibacteria bacterium]|nr:ThiF family adenylyltransferase [Bacteroidota bacterium]MBL7128020.1 ThiF family adenylyltransferase [Ignavibacteria bacterium]